MAVPKTTDATPAPEPSPGATAANPEPHAGRGRLLTCIAVERSLRALILVSIGLVLLTHSHTNWGGAIADLARDSGFDPSSSGLQRIISRASAITPARYSLYGAVALAYGVLEGVEGYGLWTRKRWGEYLTIFATSLFFIPEVWEIVTKPTVLKAGALLINVAIVAYLVVRLRRARDRE